MVGASGAPPLALEAPLHRTEARSRGLLAEEEGGRTVHVREQCILAVCANEECPLVRSGAEGAKLKQCLGCKGSSYCRMEGWA